MQKTNACGLKDQTHAFDDDETVLKLALRDSVTFQHALVDIWDTCQNGPAGMKKTIVYYSSPRVGEFFRKVLNFVGINNILLSSANSLEDRYVEVKNFNNPEHVSRALLCPLTLKMRGMNAHYACARVMCLDITANLALLEQAVGRVHRYGQLCEQIVSRYVVEGSWAEVKELQVMKKAVRGEWLTNDLVKTLMRTSTERITLAQATVSITTDLGLGPRVPPGLQD